VHLPFRVAEHLAGGVRDVRRWHTFCERISHMATTLRVIVVDSDSELARLLDEQDGKPFILRRGDESWRVILDDDAAGFDPEEALAALESAIGSWGDIDAGQMIADVRKAREEGSRPPDRP
jgi:hypothetical protein